jgi:hypothetical protein
MRADVMTRFGFATATALAAILAGCASESGQYSPFKVSQDAIRSRVKTIALAPVSIDEDVPNADPAQEEFATLLIKELNDLGFQTVPPAEYDKTFKRLRDEAGGFFDPSTGKRDKEKYQKVLSQCRHELATKYHADAVIYSAIIVQSVPFSGNVAYWNGVKEAVAPGGMWSAALLGNYSRGSVPALSFAVNLDDIEGNRMYTDVVGLQLLEKINGDKFYPVPVGTILTDPQREANAVRIALRAFRDKSLRHK